MLTKTQYAKSLIQNNARGESERILSGWVTSDDVGKSSSVAVAVEFLGLTTDPLILDYCRSRGGYVSMYFNPDQNTCEILSARELLDILPD